MTLRRPMLVAPALLALALAACESKEKPKETPAPAAAAAPAEPLKVEESAQVSMTATVKAINLATREVTLRDAAGHEESFVVGPAVKRLDEVKVGDDVTAECTVSILGELRPPTADEKAHPIVAVEASGRAPRSSDPAAAAVRAFKVVTTVQVVDLTNMLVTLQGPLGNRVTFRAKRPERVKQLHVGDTIVITYTEAVAVSLEKAAPKK